MKKKLHTTFAELEGYFRDKGWKLVKDRHGYFVSKGAIERFFVTLAECYEFYCEV